MRKSRQTKKVLLEELSRLRQKVRQLEGQDPQQKGRPVEPKELAEVVVVSRVVDEINDGLTVIYGYSELAQHELSRDSVMWQRLQHIRTAGQRLATLLQQLLPSPHDR
jgi:signal transduction histidine kinase